MDVSTRGFIAWVANSVSLAISSLRIFSRLITSLAEEADFSLKEVYELNSNEFELAIEVLEEWRLDRFYMGKAKVFDVAQQALEMGSSEK